jgi:uncharacterized protein (DUF608 family)
MRHQDESIKRQNSHCGCSSPGCGGGIERRDFIKTLALGATATLGAATPVMAGPWNAADFENMVPADKKLDPAWVASLSARGTPTVYHGAELQWIGMPVGGICAGQLYLGGDGRLWHWDIFNQSLHTGGGSYAHPPQPSAPLEQGFALKIAAGGKVRVCPLDQRGFRDIAFRGEYPIGLVEYRDPTLPVTAALEAFSPFIPLSPDDSALPATILRFTLKNVGPENVEAELTGWLENAVGLYTAFPGSCTRQNRVDRGPLRTLLKSSARANQVPSRPDVVFENFQKASYDGWEVTGTAFGAGPILKSNVPAYQGDLGVKGPRVVNSHASAPGKNVGEKDAQTGTLTSKPFTIQRNFITFWIGGGNHPGKTCINLLLDGRVARTATGHNDNKMRREFFDVRELQGKTARLEIVDRQSGPWGNIGVGEIAFSDRPAGKAEEQPDFGTLALALLEPGESDLAMAAVPAGNLPEMIFVAENQRPSQCENRPVGEKLVGALGRKLSLAPGQAATVTFVVAWHFPNLHIKDGGQFYARRFASAAAVADYVAANFERLAGETRLWRDTWYDSSLPYWFLDRTFLNTSILATATSHWFESGRFYGWEGVGCCEGTCTHVWHYAHAVARLFPQLERDLRRRTDFGLAQNPETGVINHRGESAGLAVDGQAGCILRAYREHQMSADDRFLKPLWPKIKLAMQCLMRMDDGQGILEGPQHNTLDQPWFGKVAWLSSLYVAAARACEEMAQELADEPFARLCHAVVERGSRNIDRELFNGEYYLQLADKEHLHSVGSHNGCEIDQVFGQSWAFQVGLGRILPEPHVRQALASLWKYNFTPDVGPYRAAHKPGRWYAMAGEGGLLMCSWPHGEGARMAKGFDFYFNECMTGFEYQVAGHMLWEGMLTEGLAVTRAVHDRYHASRRNPWNEVECGDHYARAMASYGVYLAACGFVYHGPKGYLEFAPRLHPEDFRAALTTAEGWGTFSQQRRAATQTAAVEIRWGKLRLRTLALTLAGGATGSPSASTKTPAEPVALSVQAKLGGAPLECRHRVEEGKIVVELAREAVIEKGKKLEVTIA